MVLKLKVMFSPGGFTILIKLEIISQKQRKILFSREVGISSITIIFFLATLLASSKTFMGFKQ